MWKGSIIAYVILILLASNAASNELPYNYGVNSNIFDFGAERADSQPNHLHLYLTISARQRLLEVSWNNAPAQSGDKIFITKQPPQNFKHINSRQVYAFNIVTGGNSAESSSPSPRQYWISNDGENNILATLQPTAATQWFTTGVPFDFALSRNVTAESSCYGYWASYVNGSGTILATTCMRAYPRWMSEMRDVVGSFRLRDLFIPGTHDSGAYKTNFHPLANETVVTKYSLTQDDDIRGQLLHGARYLDIRVGYYRNTPEKFFVNHGITQQHPLEQIIEQVKKFVLETNEIVIFGLKEFPVGFGKDLSVHRLLVTYLEQLFGAVIVNPSATWRATLNNIWSVKQNVILAYDERSVVAEFPELLFEPVKQFWGNVQTWPDLEKYLRSINGLDVSRSSSRPVADMAELTPSRFGIILDKYGGLRKMADDVNWHISQLYDNELGKNANIVAADFIRGTTLIESAIEWNKRKK